MFPIAFDAVFRGSVDSILFVDVVASAAGKLFKGTSVQCVINYTASDTSRVVSQ